MRLLLSRVLSGTVDLLVISAAFWFAFCLRFEGLPPKDMLKRAIFLWPYIAAGQYTLLTLFGVSRFSWRHVGLWETKRILQATLLSTAVLLVIRLGTAQSSAGYVQYLQVPIGVILIDALLMFTGVTGIRVLRRVMFERYNRQMHAAGAESAVSTLLIGAGQAGVMVAKEISNWPNLGIQPVGYVDDDPLKAGALIQGLRVLGTTSQIEEVARSVGAKQALITIADVDGRTIRRIAELCRQAELPTKIIPGVFEIVGGRVNLSRIRDVSIQDLLGRDPVHLERESIQHVVRGRVVLVTGGAGSIGKELCMQVARFEPKLLVLLDQNESGLFYAVREVKRLVPEVEIVARVGDICDEERMGRLFDEYRPAAVFHAAAYKHVGMMERNVSEAVRNNVFGTRVVADLAARWKVSKFVLISTDKAVNPSSVMGATKRLAEMYVQALSHASETLFVAVRFGNVLGSAGSVVPLFTEQIQMGGPVTVTHPEMRRYFMTIEEASQLVLQAAGIGRGGEIFILDMGKPVKIVDLAKDLITLSGLRVEEDIEIVFIGIQPGEKLFEELSVSGEKADRTRHPKIYIERISPLPLTELRRRLDGLARSMAMAQCDLDVRAALEQLVPEFGKRGGEVGQRRSEREMATAPVAQAGG